ncbi:MAG: hypothetical protein R3345_00720, partial [Fulvivirga sp.]|nr:hypothetical protein [Fulvivirga sp.]
MRIIIISIFILWHFDLYCQQDYLITLDEDTIRDVEIIEFDQQAIQYEKSGMQSIALNQVKEFGFRNKVYTRKTLGEQSRWVSPVLSSLIWVYKDIFSSKFNTSYFIVNQNQQSLKVNFDIIEDQLNSLLTDYTEYRQKNPQPRILDEKDLIFVLSDYAHFMYPEKYQVVKAPRKQKSYLGFGLAPVIGTFNIDNTSYARFSVSPSVIFSALIAKKTSLSIGIRYFASSVQDENLTFKAISIPFGLRYNLTNKPTRTFFLIAGLETSIPFEYTQDNITGINT